LWLVFLLSQFTLCISQEYILHKYINSLCLSCCVIFLSHEYNHKNVIRLSSITTVFVYELGCKLLHYVFQPTIKKISSGGRVQRENCTYVTPCLVLVLTASKSQLVNRKTCTYRGEVHPRASHEGPEGELMYSSTLCSTSVLNVGGW